MERILLNEFKNRSVHFLEKVADILLLSAFQLIYNILKRNYFRLNVLKGSKFFIIIIIIITIDSYCTIGLERKSREEALGTTFVWKIVSINSSLFLCNV